MKILADTSVWVDHLRHGNPRMALLLEKNVVNMHAAVLGELACGNLPDRARFLRDLDNLPKSPDVPQDEALAFLEGRRLFGRGLGWTDIHLLASALVAGAGLWTLDKPLLKAAERLHIAF